MDIENNNLELKKICHANIYMRKHVFVYLYMYIPLILLWNITVSIIFNIAFDSA